MAYRFVKRDIGQGKRSKLDHGDCTVRALALARGITYEAGWNLLFAAQSLHRTCGFQLFRFLDADPVTFGVLKAASFPASAGKKRTTVRSFAESHRKGCWIVQVANHATTVIDGVLYDKWDCSRKCVYRAWQIEQL